MIQSHPELTCIYSNRFFQSKPPHTLGWGNVRGVCDELATERGISKNVYSHFWSPLHHLNTNAIFCECQKCCVLLSTLPTYPPFPHFLLSTALKPSPLPHPPTMCRICSFLSHAVKAKHRIRKQFLSRWIFGILFHS